MLQVFSFYVVAMISLLLSSHMDYIYSLQFTKSKSPALQKPHLDKCDKNGLAAHLKSSLKCNSVRSHRGTSKHSENSWNPTAKTMIHCSKAKSIWLAIRGSHNIGSRWGLKWVHVDSSWYCLLPPSGEMAPEILRVSSDRICLLSSWALVNNIPFWINR